MIDVQHLSANAGRFALDDVTFTVPDGGWGMVIGPAGAGKTTLLEAIAGIVRARAGVVRLDGRDVTRLAPEARGLSLVYQHAFLFPHLSVRENVEYGSRRQGVAQQMIERFGLGTIADRGVQRLSGGERQLVALARALAAEPRTLLLDEPFAALDPRTRIAVRRELRTWYWDSRCTVLHVTHDFGEAGVLGDVAVLLDGGRVLQAGAPEDLFRRPANAYVAGFLGAENVLAGHAQPIRAASPDYAEAREGEHAEQAVAFTTGGGGLTFYALGDVVPGPAHAVIRGEDVMLLLEVEGGSSARNQFRGKVAEIVPAGALSRVAVDLGGVMLVAAVTTRSVGELGLVVGKDVVAGVKATAVYLC